MKLVAGLGNPDKKYEKSRHNTGFLVCDFFVRDEGLLWKYNPDWICYFVKTEGFVVVKPTTYMNRSGDTILSVSNYYKIPPEDILVIADDVDLPYGKIRVAFNGLSAGHKGIESVVSTIGMEFARLRIGIGRPEDSGSKSDVSDFVLSDFFEEEEKQLPGIIAKSANAVRSWLSAGIQATMNRFN